MLIAPLFMLWIALQLCERLPSPMGESAVDCAVLSTMPSISFTIGGKQFDLKPEQVLDNLSYFIHVCGSIYS